MRIRERGLEMLYMRVEGTGVSAGACRDDQQQGKKTAKVLKIMWWLMGQSSASVNRIFLIIWVLNHRPKGTHTPCIPFIQGVLFSQRAEERLAEIQKQWSKRSCYLWVWKGGECGNKCMFKMWLLDTVVIFLVWWRSWGHTDDGAHGDKSSQGWEVLWKLLCVCQGHPPLDSTWLFFL